MRTSGDGCGRGRASSAGRLISAVPDPPGYDPPDYRTVEHFFDGELIGEADRLFAHGGLSELRRARKLSMPETVRRIAELVAAEPVESWVIWCELNAEAEALAKGDPGGVNLHGSLSETREGTD